MTKILIVDDAILSRKKLISILVQEGFELLEAKDGIEGVAMAIEHQPEVCRD